MDRRGAGPGASVGHSNTLCVGASPSHRMTRAELPVPTSAPASPLRCCENRASGTCRVNTARGRSCCPVTAAVHPPTRSFTHSLAGAGPGGPCPGATSVRGPPVHSASPLLVRSLFREPQPASAVSSTPSTPVRVQPSAVHLPCPHLSLQPFDHPPPTRPPIQW